MDNRREQLAELEHEQWVVWSQAIASIEKHLDPDRLKRWKTLWIPYAELTEEQKDQDRIWADKVLALLGPPSVMDEGKFQLNKLFCQHCKAIQKVTGAEADCLYNPLLEEGQFAFCGANLDAVKSISALIKATRNMPPMDDLLLSPEDKFQVSLVSKYPYESVEDVIDEACNWQLVKATRNMPPMDEVCPECKGRKRVPSQSGLLRFLCERCKGTGRIPTKLALLIKGITPVCSECDGKGDVGTQDLVRQIDEMKQKPIQYDQKSTIIYTGDLLIRRKDWEELKKEIE